MLYKYDNKNVMEISECAISNRPCGGMSTGRNKVLLGKQKKIENTLSYVFENYELSNTSYSCGGLVYTYWLGMWGQQTCYSRIHSL